MSKWKIDSAHATAQFKVQHLGISWVPGHVYGITGDVEFDESNVEASKFDAVLDLNTLTTGLAMRDDHLKSPDFLDVQKYPSLRFESLSVKRTSDKHFTIRGNLTIKDITKEVEINAEYLGEAIKPNMDGTSSTVASFIIEAQIDRRDYGINWNIDLPGGKVLVGNEVHITIDLETIKE